MVSNAQIKLINSLSQKKYRKANKLFVAEGVKLVNEILNSSLKIHTIYGTAEWLETNSPRFSTQKSFELVDISDKELKKLSQLSSPNQVLALVEMPSFDIPENPENFMVYLDGIRDPGNLGTIIRNADWFGLPHVFCSPDCVDAFNSKVIQASMGSICRVSPVYTELTLLKEHYSAHQLIGAVLDGSPVSSLPDKSKIILVIGNESMGIRPEYLKLLDKNISIPGKGNAESLNASVAMGILSYLLL